MKKYTLIMSILAVCSFTLSSCSINRMAMNAVANALTGDGGADVFTSDPDPQLVADAIPFAIKMYETLLAANPGHQGLMYTTGSIFVMYANAFVQGPAEMLPVTEWQARENGLRRAKQLYLRGYELLYDAMEAKYRGFRQASSSDGSLQAILARFKKEDVGLLYWAVAGGLSAYSLDVMDFELSSKIPDWTLMIHRAYELDPDFQGAALDEFFVIFYASLPELLGGDIEKAKLHFQRAIEKTGGNSASAYVAYVQTISIPENDYDTFREYLEIALAIDPNEDVSTRLVTIISQEKAQWLLDNAWQFFSSAPVPEFF